MRTLSPSLIILDQQIIETEGNGFMEELRKSPNYRKVPIIAMTGCEKAEAKEKADAEEPAPVVAE